MDNIYDFRKQLNKAKELTHLEVSDEAQMIEDYVDALSIIKKISLSRQILTHMTLRLFRRDYLKKPYKTATKENLIKAVTKFSNSKYAAWTKSTRLGIVKRFYRYVDWGIEGIARKDFPERTAWINSYLRKMDQPKISPNEILTENEVEQMISAVYTSRDRAFLSAIYEMGSRIGEIGNLKIKDVVEDEYSFMVHLKGKTGQRCVRIIQYQQYMVEWLNVHPLGYPDAPLWVNKNNTKMVYPALRAIIRRTKNKTDIKKKIYPHLFRHTRVTHLLGLGFNEAQVKAYMGWSADSNQLSTYSHLTTNDVNNKMLEKFGVKTKTEAQASKQTCMVCRAINPILSKFCSRCGRPLNEKILLDAHTKQFEEEKRLLKLLANPQVRAQLLEVLQT